MRALILAVALVSFPASAATVKTVWNQGLGPDNPGRVTSSDGCLRALQAHTGQCVEDGLYGERVVARREAYRIEQERLAREEASQGEDLQ